MSGPPAATGLIRSRKPAGAAIIKDFQVAWSRASPGAAGLLFQAGSISKPVTTLAALELAACGQVSLDGDVNDYLTSWQVPGPLVVSLRPFAEAAQALVLEPLGMTSSTFGQPLAPELRQAAARQDWHIYPETAAAGLWTTPGDLARFTCALTAAAAGRPSPIPARTAAQILGPHTPLPVKGEWNLLPLLGIRPPTAFGLGMFLHGQDRFSHIGGAYGFFSMLTGCPDGTGAVVMTATGSFLPAFRLLSAISRDQHWTTFRQPARKRLHGLPGIRALTRPRS